MRAPLNYGQNAFAVSVADAVDEATGRTNRLNNEARRIVDEALDRFGGRCAAAYADVLNRYISAPPGGRDALFLAVAYRAVGTNSPSPTPMTDQVDRASAETSFRRSQKLPRLLRAFRRLLQQARS